MGFYRKNGPLWAVGLTVKPSIVTGMKCDWCFGRGSVANFDGYSIRRCSVCHGMGKLVKSVHTRGMSLCPNVNHISENR